MSAQDAKKKDSKPQPTENERLRAAMVSSCLPSTWLQCHACQSLLFVRHEHEAMY